ncbi:Cell wall hydrolase, SleB domain protein [Candidatus Magnetobacterium bavaricum]|uniref:Cell wall hydrolase, SleB domain protein n=1 Tax=Candidatus Magnetobacterium bavaricum TaxID=29290 RepID=A0A0F3H0I9_9BACT|nr:Cell wall hydrolase, SleB domain protein [Candidatus Magnetobacterium bavaricum]
MLLATTILCEAGGENELGKQAVAQVIMNRVSDKRKRYGNGLHEVILRKFAFSYLNKAGFEKAKKALATIFHHGEITDMAFQFLYNLQICPAVKGATHYFNPNLATPEWADSEQMKRIIQIGDHVFYEEL